MADENEGFAATGEGTGHPTDEILDAVDALLAEGGPDSLTYRAIAARAGLSVGTVAYYFGSQSELFEAALETHHSKFLEMVRPLFSAGKVRTNPGEVAASLTRYAFAHRPHIRLRMAAWMLEWKLPAARLHLVESLLDQAARVPWLEGWSTAERRVLSQAFVYAAQRFACLGDEELRRVVGTKSADEAVEIVVETMRRMCECFVREA